MTSQVPNQVMTNSNINATNHSIVKDSFTKDLTYMRVVSHGSVVVSKHGLYVGGPGSIPTAITTMTAAGGDAEHVSLNH